VNWTCDMNTLVESNDSRTLSKVRWSTGPFPIRARDWRRLWIRCVVVRDGNQSSGDEHFSGLSPIPQCLPLLSLNGQLRAFLGSEFSIGKRSEDRLIAFDPVECISSCQFLAEDFRFDPTCVTDSSERNCHGPGVACSCRPTPSPTVAG
jgi:hypothetical protein